METYSAQTQTPWGGENFFAEAGLKAAQEYFFQTHGKQSRMVAEGRQAQGIMKSYIRRKLAREMGEDFKMYTGLEVGSAAKDDTHSTGIRGELNSILHHVYNRISPGKAYETPIQEDLDILNHPQGALEVCFALIFYNNELSKRFASMAGNRRKVLKGILDEELFKWIWRLFMSYSLRKPELKSDFENSGLTRGLQYIPHERQSVTQTQKVLDIGFYLLGKNMAESDVRFQITYYFVCYLRQAQSFLLMQPGLVNADAIYGTITKRKPDDPVDNLLVAMDVLMNATGTSAQSFDDILGDEEALSNQLMPGTEAEFVRSFDPCATEEGLKFFISKMLPAKATSDNRDQVGGGLMALLLVMRSRAAAVRKALLDRLPGPFLVLIRNRVTHGDSDDADKSVLADVERAMEERSKRGESYTIQNVNRRGPMVSAAEAEKRENEALNAAIAPAAGAAKGSVQTKMDLARLLDERLIVHWRTAKEDLVLTTISPRDVIALMGAEPRALLPWLLYAVKTGQCLTIQRDKVSKELMSRIIKGLLERATRRNPAKLSSPQRAAVLGMGNAVSPAKVLQQMLKLGGMADKAGNPGTTGVVVHALAQRFEGQLGEFLKQPAAEAFVELRQSLTDKEKTALAVLQRVARAQ